MKDIDIIVGGGQTTENVNEHQQEYTKIKVIKHLKNVILKEIMIILFKCFLKCFYFFFSNFKEEYYVYLYYTLLSVSSSSKPNEDYIGESDTFSFNSIIKVSLSSGKPAMVWRK